MHNHIIGLFYDCEETDIVTLEQLKEKVEEIKETNDYIRKYNLCERVYTYENLEDFLDSRKVTSFKRFNYCPECGEKINYRKIRKDNKQHENR